MGKRNFRFVTDGIYHVYNRGVDKRVVYKDKKDFDRFLLYLELCQFDINIENINKIGEDHFRGLASESKQLVEIESFCLIKNHFHLIVKQIDEDGVTCFMQKLGTAYTMYFNARYNRSGSLFQGKYKAKPVDTDGYYQFIKSYVTLNYAVHGVKENQYRSCLDDLYRDESISNYICARTLAQEYSTVEKMTKAYSQRLKEVITKRELDRNLRNFLID